MDEFIEKLHRIPSLPIALVILLVQGYFYYDYTTSPESPYVQMTGKSATLNKEIDALKNKIKSAQDFARQLDVKKTELRLLAKQLEEMRVTVSDVAESAQFLEMIFTEAKKAGVTVVELAPMDAKKFEFYEEFPFKVQFRGAYQQLLVLLGRLASAKKILRVDDFDMKLANAKIVSKNTPRSFLEGTMIVKAYRYLGSKADDVAKANANANTAQPENAAAAPPAAKPAPQKEGAK